MTRHIQTSALAAALAFDAPAMAQMTADVAFAPGNYGTISGDDYMNYRLGARVGQEVFAELTVIDSNGDGTIYSDILPAGSDGVALYNGAVDGNTTPVDLPDTGTYTFCIYLIGNDADSGATTGFKLDLSIQ